MKKVGLLLCLLGLTLVVVLPPLLGFVVYKEIGKRTETQIDGVFTPAFFTSSFNIENVSIEWQEKVKLNSGNLNVVYQLWPFLTGRGLRLKISGQNLPVTLMGDLVNLAPQESIIIQDFYADLTISNNGLQEINALKAISPEMQFQFGLAG